VQCLHDGLLPKRQHADASAIAATDAARSLAADQIGAAVSTLFRRVVAQSLWALVEQTPKLSRLTWRRKQTASACSGGSEAPLLNPMRYLAPHLPRT
jgi:hypothetical protein